MTDFKNLSLIFFIRRLLFYSAPPRYRKQILASPAMSASNLFLPPFF